MRIISVLVIFSASLFAPYTAHAKEVNETKFRKEIVKHLSKTIDSKKMNEIFLNDPRLQLDQSIAETKKSQDVDYMSEKVGLLSLDSIDCGLEYWNKNERELDEAYRVYGVPPEAILGILRVETYFGAYLGERRAINALYSIYVLVPRRREFARNELEHLLRIAEQNETDVFEIYGSSAGAFGISQFMPSSYNAFGVDGNNDRRVDLFNDADAIFSIAHYLAESGWDEKEKNKRKAIRSYNHSNAYVDAVLAYAEKLGEKKYKDQSLR